MSHVYGALQPQFHVVPSTWGGSMLGYQVAVLGDSFPSYYGDFQARSTLYGAMSRGHLLKFSITLTCQSFSGRNFGSALGEQSSWYSPSCTVIGSVEKKLEISPQYLKFPSRAFWSHVWSLFSHVSPKTCT